ncbi:Hypothetical predicted protein, partial [Paramuricea clavata]
NKLQNDFGIGGSLLTWLKSYLSDRTQYTVVNGKESSIAKITYGIPQGSVLGPTLFALFTNDLPENVETGNVYMYAEDTMLYCIEDSADEVVSTHNKALSVLYVWCIANQLTPHPQKIFLGEQMIKCAFQSRHDIFYLNQQRTNDSRPRSCQCGKKFVKGLLVLMGIYPDDWKIAKVVPVFKNGTRTCNYSEILKAINAFWRESSVWSCDSSLVRKSVK